MISLTDRALRHASFMIGGVLVALLVATAVLSVFWTPHSPYDIDVPHKLEGPTAAHWLAPRHTARRRNTGSRSRLASSSISFAKPLPGSRRRSGTHHHSTRLTSTVAATR